MPGGPYGSKPYYTEERMQKLSSLVTLGTAAGPPPRAHRAQASNPRPMNGTPYIIDAC